jgi:hypothetical protein
VTEPAGLADLEGVIYGESVPSTSGVKVIGPAPDDFALNIHVETRSESYWLAPEHIELIDHNAGLEMRLDGVPKRWVRRADGGWDELHDDASASSQPVGRRPWWRRLFSR